MTVWLIKDEEARVLEECRTVKAAQRAQRRWHRLSLYGGGPETVIRRIVRGEG